MDANTLWVLALAASAPIAGVVGFAIQLRQVRQAKLENEKLLLEIEALKRAAEFRERRIQQISTDEVIRYGQESRGKDILFSRGGPNPGPDDGPPASKRMSFKDALLLIGLGLLVVSFIGYAIYDLYRLLGWVWSLF